VNLPIASSLPVLVLAGPTAIGKTALSLEIARRFNCEIVSVDSMQVYRDMDIGTAKASRAERAEIPHHLIDIVNPDEQYDVARFVDDATAAIHLIHNRNKLPLLAGGTGLYLKALTEGIFSVPPIGREVREGLKEEMQRNGPTVLHRQLFLCDPVSAARIHVNDSQRILRALEIYLATGVPWSEHLRIQAEKKGQGAWRNMLQIGLTCDRQVLYERINERCRQMISGGLEQEIYDLFSRGFGKDLPSLNAIGYRHMIKYIEKIWTLEEALSNLARDTRRYAKRQYTWFHGMQTIEWYQNTATEQILERLAEWLSQVTSVRS
jgi:tRNA dimethylallyltransferase